MALKKETLSLSFDKGLNTKASDRVLNLPHMADIKNGRMEKTGEIRRRNGLDPLQNTNLPDWIRYDYHLGAVLTKDKFTKVVNVGSRKDELVLLDGKDAYGKQGDHEYVRKGVCDSITMRNDILRDDRNWIQSRAELGRIDDATHGNWILAVWFEVDPSWQGHTANDASATVTYNIYAQLWDADTQAEFGQRQLVQSYSIITMHADISPERAYFSPKPRIVVSGNNFVILWNQMVIVSGPVTENHLRYRIINMASTPLLGVVRPSTSTSLLTVSDPTIGMHAAWDACEFTYDEEDGIAVFVRLGTGSTSYKLQEYVIDSGSLVIGPDSRVYSVTQTATPRTSINWTKEKPNPYGVFIRHHQPNGSASDVGACYTLGMNQLVSTLAEGRFQLIDAQTSILALEGSEISDADCEGMLNGSAVLDPSASPSTHVRVYYVAETLNTDFKPNDTTLKSIKFTIANGTAVNTKIAMNTGLLSDPWVEDGRIYFMGSEACAPQGDQDYESAVQQFVAGATYIFRDSLNDGPTGAAIFRDRCIPVARTNGEGEVSVNPYINHYLLNNNFPGQNIAEFAVSMYWGASRVIAGSNPDQKIIGNNRWAEFLEGSNAIFATSLVTVSHQPRRSLPMVEHNENLLIGGGFMMSYDGYAVNENGFLRAPEFSKTHVTNNAAKDGVTARMETGTYTYSAIYEYIDAAGNRHHSPPSLTQTVEIVSAGSDAYVTSEIYTYNHSLRYREDVRIILYRTTKTQTNLYRVADVANDWYSKKVSITDIWRDDDIFPEEDVDAAHEILYSSIEKKVGIPGSISDMVVHKNRIVYATVDNRVFAAKPPVRTQGMEPFSEADVQFGEVEGGTEPVHGIETVGDHLLVLTKNNVYVISGEGPDANGGTSAFTPPRLLVAGQGAIEGTFHINTPSGVLYQSERGIYGVTRELEMQYIGAPVEDFGVYRALTAAADDSRNEVYIPLGSRLDGSSVATGYSTVLVFNYFFNTWMQYTYDKDYVGYNSPGMHLHNGTVYFGRMRYASYSGRTSTYDLDSSVVSGIWQENQSNYWDTKYGDPATYSKYDTVIETPFVYMNQLQGAQRIYEVQFLGDYLGDHDITVEMTVDYDASSAHSQTKTASTLTNKDVYRVAVKRQKCRSLKVKHTITPNSSSTLTNELFRMDGMALEVGFRPTTFKLAAGDTI